MSRYVLVSADFVKVRATVITGKIKVYTYKSVTNAGLRFTGKGVACIALVRITFAWTGACTTLAVKVTSCNAIFQHSLVLVENLLIVFRFGLVLKLL